MMQPHVDSYVQFCDVMQIKQKYINILKIKEKQKDSRWDWGGCSRIKYQNISNVDNWVGKLAPMKEAIEYVNSAYPPKVGMLIHHHEQANQAPHLY